MRARSSTMKMENARCSRPVRWIIVVPAEPIARLDSSTRMSCSAAIADRRGCPFKCGNARGLCFEPLERFCFLDHETHVAPSADHIELVLHSDLEADLASFHRRDSGR